MPLWNPESCTVRPSESTDKCTLGLSFANKNKKNKIQWWLVRSGFNVHGTRAAMDKPNGQVMGTAITFRVRPGHG